MTVRDKFFKNIRRQMEGYIPFDFDLCPSLYKQFVERTGKQSYKDYYEMPLRFVYVEAFERKIDFRKYYKDIEEDVFFSEWGIAYKRGSMEHFVRMFHPLENFETIEEFENYPYPDPERDFNWAPLQAKINNLKNRDLVVIAALGATIFELAWVLRGMEQLMTDMILNPELACYQLDRIMYNRCEFAKKYALYGVDIIQLGDDVSTQLDMMMSPELWRKFLKPRLKHIIQTVKEINPDLLIEYHGDGNLQKIIPDLIEVGVDILNPVQPECMDPVEIKKLYGDKLSFRGTIGTQTTMPFGSPEEVEEVCWRMICEVGRGGGLVLAPSHVLEPEVSWDNIEAMIRTVKNYNQKQFC